MESEVHKSLCYICRTYAVFLHEISAVQQALVGNSSGRSGVNSRELVLQRLGDVVGVQYSYLAGFLQSFSAQQLYENAAEVLNAIAKLKPQALKGTYMKSAALCSTMSPGIKVDLKAFLNKGAE